LYRPDAVTLLQGIRDRAPSGTSVLYAKGCGIYEPEKAGFLEAVNAAKAADVSVVAVGECSIMQKGYGCGENTEDVAVSGESYDRSELDLPGIQAELVKAVMETGTPTVIVLINGRPLSIIDLAENAYAILEAWYPGEQGGFALAEILFGHVCPSGRLPVSFPKSVGQIPVYYNHQPSARGYYKNPGTPLKPGRDYVFCDTRPLYEFGYGLSYTSFEYKNLEIVTETCSEETVARVHLIVKNTGSRQGMETVQMYIRDVAGSVATPVKVLRRFQKIELLPGEQKEIDFDIKLEDLSLLDRDMKMVLEQGEFEIMVGASSEDIRLKGILNIREGRKI
jgi:Glycosyl hydrolase family 3 C terminal domain.